MDKKEYFQEYYRKNKNRINEKNRNYYYDKKNKNNPSNVFYPGELVKLKNEKTGVVVKDYGKYVRLNISAGETYYSECFYRGDLEKYE